MANVLLIYPAPEFTKDWRFGFSLNLLYLSSILKQMGHYVVFLDYSVERLDLEKLKHLLGTIDVAIIEFDSFPLKRSLNVYNGEYLAEFIKLYSQEIKTIAFGNDCLLNPRSVPNIDYMFEMEPDNTVNYVVQCLLDGIKIDVTKLSSMNLDELDDLPLPDRELLNRHAEHGGTINKKANLAKSTLIQTSRGCMNTCRFCQRKGWAKEYREHSIDYVIREFREISSKDYVNVWVCDDNFTFNLKRAKTILKRLALEKITEGMHIALSSWTNIDYEFLDLAKDANISVISIGVESANRNILDFYAKKIDLKKTQELVNYADQLGIYIVGNFIVGAPMETEETIDNTFQYIMEAAFDQVNIKVLDYMLGADLYNSLPNNLKNAKRHVFACKENGLNDFEFDFLRTKIDSFQVQFSKQRRNHLIKKINKYGFPYEMVYEH